MPDRFRQADELAGGRPGNPTPPNQYLPTRRRGAPASLWRNEKIPDRPALAGLGSLLRVLPWGQWGRDRGQSSDGLDRLSGALYTGAGRYLSRAAIAELYATALSTCGRGEKPDGQSVKSAEDYPATKHRVRHGVEIFHQSSVTPPLENP